MSKAVSIAEHRHQLAQQIGRRATKCQELVHHWQDQGLDVRHRCDFKIMLLQPNGGRGMSFDVLHLDSQCADMQINDYISKNGIWLPPLPVYAMPPAKDHVGFDPVPPKEPQVMIRFDE